MTYNVSEIVNLFTPVDEIFYRVGEGIEKLPQLGVGVFGGIRWIDG